jgi:outer membrane receptor protein involved in Fe transport
LPGEIPRRTEYPNGHQSIWHKSLDRTIVLWNFITHQRRVMTNTSSFFRKKLLFTAMTAVFVTNVYAQAQPEEGLEEIQITGSRIRNVTSMSTPTPVTAITADELTTFNPGSTVAEQLDSLPQFFATATPQRGGLGISNNAGGSYLNLRGMGQSRTLVLLDGSRIIPADANGSVNIDNFPNALVTRVDVVTGGASAAYGADAVSGVVNFVLDRDFEGLKTSLSAGTSEKRVGDNWNFSVAGGTAVMDGRMHLIGSLESRNVDQIMADPELIDNWEDWGLVQNPAWVSATATPNIPRRLTVPNVFSNAQSAQGLIIGAGTGVDSTLPGVGSANFSLSNYTFTDDGKSVRPYAYGKYSPATGGGAQSNQAGGQEYETWKLANNRGPDGAEVVQRSMFLGAKYDFTDQLSVYGQVIAGRTESNIYEQRRGLHINGRFGPGNVPPAYAMTIYRDNPYLPKVVKDAMIAENKDYILVNKGGIVRGPDKVNLYEHGADRSIGQLESATAGFEYDFENSWNLTGSFQRGESKVSTGYLNVPRIDKYYLALDAVTDASGKIVCNISTVNPTAAQLKAFMTGKTVPSPLDIRGVAADSPIGPVNPSECQPLNVFGLGNSSQAAVDWLEDIQKKNFRTLEQDFAELLLTGEVYEGWGAGPIFMATGLTWRDESFTQISLPEYGERGLLNAPLLGIRGMGSGPAGQGNRSLHPFSSLGAGNGASDVTEVFAELNVPVLELSSGQTLGTSLAYRSSDYSSSGRVASWKWGLDAELFSDLRWRFTKSHDVREPNFAERYLTGTGGGSVTDPEFGNATNNSLSAYSNPNPGLTVEEADTITTGLVYQPSFAPWVDGIQVALDWYEINLEGAIATYGAQRLVTDCFNTKDPEICKLVERDPVSRQILRVLNINVNSGVAQTRGVDLEVQYAAEPNFFGNQEESFTVRGLVGYLAENSNTSNVGTILDQAGSQERAEFTGTITANYNIGDFGFRLQENYYGDTLNDNRTAGRGSNVAWIEGVDVDNTHIASQSITNFAVSYGKEKTNGGDWRATFNITNLLDRDPPIIATAGGQVISNSHDQFGRRYQISLNMNF